MLLTAGKEKAAVSPRVMGAGQNVGHHVWAGVSTGAPPAQSSHRSPCSSPGLEGVEPSQPVCGKVPPCWPQPPWSPAHCSPVDLCQNTACGRAMTSEEKYSWFLSDVWGYGFINWWNTCQPKPLSTPAAFRSYWQMYCFQRPCVENLCSTSCFVPPEITRFLLDSIITNYLMRCDLTKAKQVHSKVSKEEDSFHARTAPKFERLGTSKISSHALKR